MYFNSRQQSSRLQSGGSVKDKKVMSPPSSDEMRTWRHHTRVLKELEPLQCLIDKVKSLGSASERAGHVERTATASTVARCQPINA
jgi:hypothetical protein